MNIPEIETVEMAIDFLKTLDTKSGWHLTIGKLL